MIKNSCVVGAGTMGSGIALALAQFDYNVILFDINQDVLESSKTAVLKNLDYLVGKQKITAEEKENIFNRIIFTSSMEECKADIIIEAIVEKIEVKESVFNKLALINNSKTILASNTSSLSISAIQKNIPNPERVVGMHFFNPANVMKLVEVVRGQQTSTETVDEVVELCKAIQKTPVRCNDAPGFIVNRVARHFYLEAMYLAENNTSSIENIDEAMQAAGFKMGPFKLMDMIGMDINLAVSESLYNAFDHAERFKPSSIQQNKVTNGELGKKTGKGFYQY